MYMDKGIVDSHLFNKVIFVRRQIDLKIRRVTELFLVYSMNTSFDTFLLIDDLFCGLKCIWIMELWVIIY